MPPRQTVMAPDSQLFVNHPGGVAAVLCAHHTAALEHQRAARFGVFHHLCQVLAGGYMDFRRQSPLGQQRGQKAQGQQYGRRSFQSFLHSVPPVVVMSRRNRGFMGSVQGFGAGPQAIQV